MEFLPLCRQDMLDRGWEQCDFVYVIGDAYVDHHSFGHAIISRILEQAGYKVGIISQPDWKKPASIDIYGKPRLGFLISGGNMDSMVNHYSVTKHRRKTDAYTPGGEMGKRPDYATVVYGNLIRQTYKDAPIIIGGIEASLRRLSHYDYWSESMKRSILLDSQADLLLYGMGDPVAAVAKLAPWIRHVHIKDALPSKKPGLEWGEETPWGDGKVNAKAFIAALDKAGYTGALAVEREGGNSRTADIALAVQRLRAI